MNEQNERNHGLQRIDAIMQAWGLDNHDLVDVSLEQLTHKQVQKVARALNVAIWNRLSEEDREQYYEYIHRDLFSYAKGYDPEWADPNAALVPQD